MGSSWLSAEESDRKLMVALPSRELAEHTRNQLMQLFGQGGGWVTVIEPDDPKIERKLEPETRRIPWTAVRSHSITGAMGAIGGLILWGVLYLIGVDLIVSSPLVSFIAIVVILSFLGLLVGGLITFRPDHNNVVYPAKDASDAGEWVVVAHPTTETETQQAQDYLQRVSEETFTQTLG